MPANKPLRTSNRSAARRAHGLALLIVSATVMTMGTTSASATDTCSNAALRTGPSAALPDCRAYELVTPDLNHASLGSTPGGSSSSDGDAFVYGANDAPLNATSGTVFNVVRATRDPVKGWSGVSLSEPLSSPTTAYFSFFSPGFSADLSSLFEVSDQKLVSGSVPPGQNAYIRHGDGSYTLVSTNAGAAFSPEFLGYSGHNIVWGNADFSHILLQSVKQLPEDPLAGNDTYTWSQEKGLRLLGILPDGTPAPGGAYPAWDLQGSSTLGPSSQDGRRVVFNTGLEIGQNQTPLYLRTDDTSTVDVGVSQRTVADPNPAPYPFSIGISDDGKQVLFTSKSELTNDAYTGRSGGVSTDAGRDIYSYDTATGTLTDLTVDTNPADVATGANVQAVLGVTPDASHVYFIAKGDLAPGAIPNHASLYVAHDGRVDFVANADQMRGIGYGFYVTPNGLHVAFLSADSLTGYDNRDPVTGQPHYELFTATLGGGVTCVSCRSDGARPMVDAVAPKGRAISEDGLRVFFMSADAVLPEASSGRQQVFEYSSGRVWPISRVSSPDAATFLNASPSGDDAFFSTYDELVANPNGGDDVIYDARVNGGFSQLSSTPCAGSVCQGPPSLAPAPGPAAGSETVDGPGDLAGEAQGPVVTVSKNRSARAVTGTRASLKVTLSGSGVLTGSGVDLRTTRVRVLRAQTVTLRLSLTAKAAQTLKHKQKLSVRVRLSFRDAGGQTRVSTVTLAFRSASTAKGR